MATATFLGMLVALALYEASRVSGQAASHTNRHLDFFWTNIIFSGLFLSGFMWCVRSGLDGIMSRVIPCLTMSLIDECPVASPQSSCNLGNPFTKYPQQLLIACKGIRFLDLSTQMQDYNQIYLQVQRCHWQCH